MGTRRESMDEFLKESDPLIPVKLHRCKDWSVNNKAVPASTKWPGIETALLRQDKGGGAWCPKNMVTKEGKEYLEVNLHSPRILTSTRTQGRFGNGQGVEYTEEYFVEYWRPGFNKWVRWRNRRGMEPLSMSSGPDTPAWRLASPSVAVVLGPQRGLPRAPTKSFLPPEDNRQR
ncbi:Discoidin domain-containing receptor 2 [Eufriesea mexicana]|nr:Discoidin domain-containing receptor 2 [Eufriesea mexicana]